MPSLSDFIGPKPKSEEINKLESLGASKPCSKCKLDSDDSFWDPVNLIMSWTCPDGHSNSYRIN